MHWSRRDFLKGMGAGTAALMIPGFSRLARAQGMGSKTLVVVFLRGGADGLDLVPPVGSLVSQTQRNGYDALRPTLKHDASSTEELDQFFRLHGSMARLKQEVWDAGALDIVHAVGGTDLYSHFASQDAMERARPGTPGLETDGWLFRTAQFLSQPNPSSLTGVSFGSSVAKSLEGRAQDLIQGGTADLSLAMNSIDSFELAAEPGVGFGAEREDAFQAIYGGSEAPFVAAAGTEALASIQEVAALSSQPGGTYQNGDAFSSQLRDVARIIKDGSLGARLVTIDKGGWDHHSDAAMRMPSRAASLSDGLTDFFLDLQAAGKQDDALVLVMTEFGRTAEENGNYGTDHGAGTVMFAVGGGVTGGRVLTRAFQGDTSTGESTPSGHWPGLLPGELHQSNQEPRDLQPSTDFRDVYGDVLQNFLGLSPVDTATILRGHPVDPPGLFI